MKHLLTLLLLVPFLATAQTNRYTGYANERILTRNLVLGSDSLGWGRIVANVEQCKRNKCRYFNNRKINNKCLPYHN